MPVPPSSGANPADKDDRHRPQPQAPGPAVALSNVDGRLAISAHLKQRPSWIPDQAAQPAGRLHVRATQTSVRQRSTVDALLQGGPADGAVRAVECEADGRPPALLLLGCGGQVFVDEADQSAPPEHPVYELAPEAEPLTPTEPLWLYRHVETLTA